MQNVAMHRICNLAARRSLSTAMGDLVLSDFTIGTPFGSRFLGGLVRLLQRAYFGPLTLVTRTENAR